MTDYIIVGAGISGVAVAETLINRGKKVLVFENHSQTSSTVAGGVYNPVILKRFTLAWNAGEQLDTAIPFYRKLEEKLGIKLLHELPVFRKFSSVEEQNNWFTAMDKPSVSPFLELRLEASVNAKVPSQFSFGKVRGTGKINTEILLSTYREYLERKGAFIEEDFLYEELKIEESGIVYKEHRARRIVFCEGFGLVQNPFFNFLPLRGNKGEYIIVKAQDLELEVAVKSSVFILPLGGGLYKVGATYDNRDTSAETTRAARETLKEQLSRMVTCDFEVVDQVAGIRPATQDRKPLVGQHPQHQHLYCCNGFGSRGILIAPSMAQDLVNFMEKDLPLDPETDLKRFL